MQKWHELVEAFRHPNVDRLSRTVLIVHVVYYGAATASPVIAAIASSYVGGMHILTSGACFIALVFELVCHKATNNRKDKV